jgi:acyl carrier protein
MFTELKGDAEQAELFAMGLIKEPKDYGTLVLVPCKHRVLCSYPPASITMDKTLEALDIDSLSIITILVNAEDAFGVKLVDTPAEQLSTIGEIVQFIAENVKE